MEVGLKIKVETFIGEGLVRLLKSGSVITITWYSIRHGKLYSYIKFMAKTP